MFDFSKYKRKKEKKSSKFFSLIVNFYMNNIKENYLET